MKLFCDYCNRKGHSNDQTINGCWVKFLSLDETSSRSLIHRARAAFLANQACGCELPRDCYSLDSTIMVTKSMLAKPKIHIKFTDATLDVHSASNISRHEASHETLFKSVTAGLVALEHRKENWRMERASRHSNFMINVGQAHRPTLTGTKNKSFTCFLKLPIELRLHIWNNALPGSRFIHFHGYVVKSIDKTERKID